MFSKIYIYIYFTFHIPRILLWWWLSNHFLPNIVAQKFCDFCVFSFSNQFNSEFNLIKITLGFVIVHRSNKCDGVRLIFRWAHVGGAHESSQNSPCCQVHPKVTDQNQHMDEFVLEKGAQQNRIRILVLTLLPYTVLVTNLHWQCHCSTQMKAGSSCKTTSTSANGRGEQEDAASGKYTGPVYGEGTRKAKRGKKTLVLFLKHMRVFSKFRRRDVTNRKRGLIVGKL